MQPSERIGHEQALRDAVVAGDATAWRALYDRAYADLWAYIVWRCAGRRDLAEEIAQETWLVAIRRVADFEPRNGTWQAWLRGIAAHCLLNHLRARRRHPMQNLSGQEVARDEGEPLERAEAILCALAELPSHYEDVLRAKYLDVQSVDAIAAEAGVSPKAIESLLTRARQAFRSAYEVHTGITVSRNHE